jgi:UDP-N-acetylmuramate--alanine ligase
MPATKRDKFYYTFFCEIEKKNMGSIKLAIPGVHNVLNALAAIGVTYDIGIPFEKIKESVENFKGVIRRFEIKCIKDDIMILDDYAHHPREIMSTLRTAREGWEGRIIAIFQPHLFSRTILLKDEFGKSFYDADIVIITDIYPSREEKIPNITGELIAKTLKDYEHREVYYIENMREIKDFVLKILRKNDMVITIGAGNINKVAEEICASI